MNWFPLQLARKYVFSGKNAIEVNVISWIAFLALGFVTACLFVIISVFSGLVSLNLQFYSDINPEIQITPAKGKTLKSNPTFDAKLLEISALEDIEVVSKVIEERAFIRYNQKNHIITIKGVDENFNQIFRLDTLVGIGNPLEPQYPDEVIIGAEVSSRLSVFPNSEIPVQLYVPKAGEGIISNPEDAVNQIMAYPTGIFFINDKYVEHVFANLPLVQRLLDYDANEYSAIEIKTHHTDLDKVKSDIQDILGDKYTVKTRQEIDAAFLKMMNTENLMIYLIFALILIIASFNLAGSVAILILDKKQEARTLHSMGYNNKQLQKTYFNTGILITTYALIFGLVVGSIAAFVQKQYNIVMVSPTVGFPVEFSLENYIITSLSVLGIGFLVSWFVSRSARIIQR